jgi:hypothetical protein
MCLFPTENARTSPFLNDAPDIAEGVAVVFMGPLVASMVGGGAGAIAAALGGEDDPLRRIVRE